MNNFTYWYIEYKSKFSDVIAFEILNLKLKIPLSLFAKNAIELKNWICHLLFFFKSIVLYVEIWHPFPNCMGYSFRISNINLKDQIWEKLKTKQPADIYASYWKWQKDNHQDKPSLQWTQIFKTNNLPCTARLDNACCKIFEKHSRTQILICSTWNTKFSWIPNTIQRDPWWQNPKEFVMVPHIRANNILEIKQYSKLITKWLHYLFKVKYS